MIRIDPAVLVPEGASPAALMSSFEHAMAVVEAFREGDAARA